MIYELNGKLMMTAEIALENILFAMEDETFCKDKAAKMVGGEGKLSALIENGQVRVEKPSHSQNGKWYCNAADILRHCNLAARKKKYKE